MEMFPTNANQTSNGHPLFGQKNTKTKEKIVIKRGKLTHGNPTTVETKM